MKFEEVKKLTDENAVGTYTRSQICFTHGKGMTLYDTNGKAYLDFLSGIAVNALGYSHKKVVKAITAQAKKLTHVSNLFYNESQAKLLSTLLCGSDFDKGFLANSGAEANEGAVKAVRKYFYDKGEKRYEIITAKNSFHGRTLLAATLTGQEKYSAPFAPLPTGIFYAEYNDIKDFESKITDKTAAIMLEVIQGEGGVIMADKEFLEGIKALTKKHKIFLIIDEVQTGIGRLGTMFGYEKFDITPDIITLAKGLGGGLPLGAFLLSSKLSSTLTPGSHGSTFGGNPLACEAGYVVLQELNNGLIEKVNTMSEYFKSKLPAVHGHGLLLGLSLGEKDGKTIVEKMLQKGFIINLAGNNTLRFAPPLIVTKTEIDLLCNALKEVL